MKAIFLFCLIIPCAFSTALNGDEDTESLLKSVLAGKSHVQVKRDIFVKEDPEIHMSPGEMAAYWGYPVELYDVTTDDGYVLSVIRIPHGRNTFQDNNGTVPTKTPVVFLQHGLDGSAADWVTNLPNQAAAYVFADAGFDVWLGNFRGNMYSRAHKSLHPSDHAFWQFSWDEMAQYDLPAMINFALNTSKTNQLYYVGFSLGTTAAFAKLSNDRDFAKKIKKFYALAPMATVGHIKGPLAWIAPFTGVFNTIFKLVGMDEFQPNSYLMDLFAKYFCGAPVSDLLCKNILFLIGGPDSKQMNQTRLPVYLSHSPGGTSTRTMIHLGQMVKSGKFQAFDYGSRKENQAHYHQDKPIEYDLSTVDTPTIIYSGGQDWLADPKDVSSLVTKLKTLVDTIYLPEYNDFDFIWGMRATAEIYFPIRKNIQSDFHAAH